MRLGLKILMVLAMTLAILIPLMMIRGIVHERQAYQAAAVTKVAASEAGAQALSGPVLVVPYVETVEVTEKDDRGIAVKVWRDQSRQWTFFPETLDVVGRIVPATRRIGLYDVRVYQFDATAKTTFRVQIPADVEGQMPRRIGRPWLSVGLGDVRGLRGSPRLLVDGVAQPLREGAGFRADSGVHALLLAPSAGTSMNFAADLTLMLGGTESLSIAPLAGRNRVAVDSTWPHPQFNGDFPPLDGDKRVDATGFHASWEVSSLATNAQAQYLKGEGMSEAAIGAATASGLDNADVAAAMSSGGLDTIGISLVEPVNSYSKADRATKYGLLFVALTFVGFFMFELIKQLRIHPIQYALVGLALAIFFLLLVSLSEHIAFGWAYLVASVACIGLLGVYVGAVLGSTWRGIGFAAMLATLYGALYGLLVSEDNALVMGAGLLFVILAAIMLITRRVDWYALSANVRS